MEVATLFGMAMLGRAVVEFIALGFGLGLLGFALRQFLVLSEKSRITSARAAMIAGERARGLIPCAS